MARIRSIKPDFFTSETIARLPMFDRLAFIGLWTHVDDNGVCVDNPALVRAALFPLDEQVTSRDVDDTLMRLSGESLVTRYVVDGKRYLGICSWFEHQKVQHPGKERYPTPDQAQEIRTPVSCDSHETLTPEQGAGSREQGAGSRETSAASLALADRFDDFWSIYPRRESKPGALKAWKSAAKRADADTIIAGAQRWAAHWADAMTERTFIAMPATWLNGDRWNDEPPPLARGTNLRTQANASSASKVAAALGSTLLELGAGA